jgi:hypothetical protein
MGILLKRTGRAHHAHLNIINIDMTTAPPQVAKPGDKKENSSRLVWCSFVNSYQLHIRIERPKGDAQSDIYHKSGLVDMYHI